MRNIIIISILLFSTSIGKAQDIYGNWVLRYATITGGQLEREDEKFIFGTKFNLKLTSKKAYKAVLHSKHHKEVFENSILEGDDFVMLNDDKGNITYSIIKVGEGELKIERVLDGDRSIFLEFEKRNGQNKHDEFLIYYD